MSEKKENAQNTKKSKGMKYTIGCLVLLIVLTSCVVLAAVGLYLVTEKNNSSFNASNPHEELEKYFVEAFKVFKEEVDLANYDENGLDVEELEDSISELNSKFKFWRSSDKDMSGKTLEVATDLSVDTSLLGSQMQIELSSDILVAYKDYDYDNLDYSNMDSDNLEEFFPDIKITGSFMSEDDTQEYSGDFDMIMTYEKLYFMLDNLSVDDEGLSEDFVEGQYYEMDIKEMLEEAFSQDTDPVDLLNLNFTPTELVDATSEMSQEDSEFLSEYGNEILDLVAQNLKSTNLFGKVEKVDPVRESNEVVCYAAPIDFEATLNSYESLLEDMQDLLEGTEYEEEMLLDLGSKSDVDDFRLQTQGLDVEITACADKKDDFVRGIGLDVSATGVSVKFDFLVVDYDSQKKIEVPSDALPLEDSSVNLDGIDSLDLMSLLGGGLYSSGLEDFSTNYDYDSDFGYDTDFDFGDDYSYDSSYYDALDELYNRYDSGELTLDEYLAEVEALSSEYGYDY